MGDENVGGESTTGRAGPDAAHLRPTLHPTYVRLLAAELKRRGFSDEQIFGGTRLSWPQLIEADRFLSFEQFRRLAERGMELTGEGWLGLDVGRSTQISAHGPVGYAMVASRNIGQALEVVGRYAPLRVEVAHLSVETPPERLVLRVEDVVGWGDVAEYAALNIIGSVTLLLETLSGTPLPDARILLTHPRPAWASEYETRVRGVTFCFDEEVCAIDMPISFGATPCITADEAAFQHAVRLCERAEAQRQGDGDLAQRVLDRLLDRQGDYPSLTEMAKGLYMSNRTLIRKLKAQGTSYQTLLDDVRQELAVWYLRQTDLTVEAIAERLGYRDTSNFSRTCKRWFGMTPRSIRQG
ncbi:MAG: AraC family transcriptional regulator ligand-binding domain-containing protein [Myxococcota bacterium]